LDLMKIMIIYSVFQNKRVHFVTTLYLCQNQIDVYKIFTTNTSDTGIHCVKSTD
jgi:hypothetical protein